MKSNTPLSLSLVLIVAAAIAAAKPVAAEPAKAAPAVPSNLVVDDGSRVFLVAHAHGTQNYVCLPNAAGFAWTLYGPQATLFDDNGKQLITHFLSANPIESGVLRPTWQHSDDTSGVWAAAVEVSTDANFVAPGAIPWLLLDVVGAQYGTPSGHKLSYATHVQRVNTAGGVAPAGGCSAAGDVGRKVLVPYLADYVFYRP